MKAIVVAIVCVTSLLLTATVSAMRIHGVDDTDTLTLLHFEPGEPVAGGNFLNGDQSDSGVSTRVTPDDDSNFTRSNENHAQWGRRVGFGPIFQPELVVDAAPVGVGVSGGSVQFDDGSVDGQFDGMEVAPHTTATQINQQGIWTDVWDGYAGFEAQLWFKDIDLNPSVLDQNEALIGAASRWEIYILSDGDSLAYVDIPTVLLIAFGESSGLAFMRAPFSLGEWHHLRAAWDPVAALPLLEVDGVLGEILLNTIAGPLQDDPAGLHMAGALKSRWYNGLIDEVQVWTSADIASVPSSGSLILLLAGLGVLAVHARQRNCTVQLIQH